MSNAYNRPGALRFAPPRVTLSISVTVGELIAGYRVGPEIGRGAMGVVHLAEDSTGRRVALKVLAPELSADERFRRRFLRESAVAAELDHRHIVSTLATGEENGVLYLALAYVGSRDLRDVLRAEGRLDPERAVRLVGEVGEALDAAHAAGLVHRDVKPSNILLADDDTAYVCDFGLARHVSSVGSLTSDRGFVGTIDYVAPEQIEGRPVDERADVYALGCVLFECLAGMRPFERENDLAVVFAHLNESPPRISEHFPDLAAFDPVIARALAKSPAARHKTCRELVGAARTALAGGTPARPRRRTVTTIALAVLVAVAASAAWAIPHWGGAKSASAAPAVTQSSIEGVRLGMTMPQVKRLLGSPWREDVFSAPGYPVLIFHERQISVYFDRTTRRAIIVTTWNPDDRDRRSIGPCSNVADVRRAFGSALKPSPWNTQKGQVYGYTLGQNLFLAMIEKDKRPTDTIGDVALYDGNGPADDGSGVNVAGGTLPFAAFVALSETMCAG